MPQDAEGTPKLRMINAAWRLFYEQGYEKTTVEDIVRTAQTSKGTFYHYFEGKDALLSSLSYLFDEKYQELMKTLDPDTDRFDQLIYLNHELFLMIENSISLDLLARLYSTQIVTKGEKHLLDRNRTYFKLLRRIVLEGQERGEFRADLPANEIVKAYALCERAFLCDFCMCNGEYSLSQYASRMLPLFLRGFRCGS